MDAEEESEGVEENVLGEVGKLQDGLNQGRLSGPKVRHKTNQNPHRCELTLGAAFVYTFLPSHFRTLPISLRLEGQKKQASATSQEAQKLQKSPVLRRQAAHCLLNGPEPSITQHAIPAFGTSP